MTFYDDAEFAAIRAVRLAIREDEAGPDSAAIHEVLVDIHDQHGSTGVTALVVALARHCSVMMNVIAHDQGKTPENFMDDFERHKLEQHASEKDDNP